MTWHDALAKRSGFITFVRAAASVFRRADDPEAFARELEQGNFEKARQHTDMSREEFASRAGDLSGLASKEIKQDEVRRALDEFSEKQCTNG